MEPVHRHGASPLLGLYADHGPLHPRNLLHLFPCLEEDGGQALPAYQGSAPRGRWWRWEYRRVRIDQGEREKDGTTLPRAGGPDAGQASRRYPEAGLPSPARHGGTGRAGLYRHHPPLRHGRGEADAAACRRSHAPGRKPPVPALQRRAGRDHRPRRWQRPDAEGQLAARRLERPSRPLRSGLWRPTSRTGLPSTG